jgi:uncharacterized membrane protein
MVSATLMIIKKIEKWQKKMFFFFLLGFFLGGSMMYFKSPEKKTFSVHFPKYSYLYTKDLKNYDESYFLKDLSKKDLLVLYKNGFIDKSTKIIDKNLNSFLFSDVFMTLKASIFDPFLIFAGCLAICAMMLPGVSGSYVLLLLGVYSSSLHAVVDLCKTIGEGSIAIDSLFYIINLSIGCVIGLAVFSRFLLWLLKNYEQMVLATITGLMTSSLYALWPFLSFYKVLDPIKGKVDFSFVSPVLPKVFSYSFFLSLLCFFIGVIFFNLLIYKSKKQELINI